MSEYIEEFERPLPAGAVIEYQQGHRVVRADKPSISLINIDCGNGMSADIYWPTGGDQVKVVSIPQQVLFIDDLKVCEKAPHGIDPHAPGAKFDSNKVVAGVLGDFSLALQAVAEVGTFGAKKYTRGGWQAVPNGAERYTDAMWRHLLYERHDTFDAESGLLHAQHLAWNCLARLELMLREKAASVDCDQLTDPA